MSLPASLGKPGVSAEQLLDESFALNDPFGVFVLPLKPEEFQDDLPGLKARLQDKIDHFIADVSHGDPVKARQIREAAAEGCKNIHECLEWSAGNPKYKDAHAGWMKAPDGSSMGGMIVEPREANFTVRGNVAYATGIDEKQLAPMDVPDAQGRFLAHWHEVAHCSGAYAEPNADKIAMIMTRKAFPDSALPQINADSRALDVLFSVNARNPDQRLERYGWAVVEAVDSAMAIPADKIRDMNEKEILSYRTEKFDSNADAVKKVWAAVDAASPGVLQEKNLEKAGAALRSALAGDAFGPDDGDARKMASRFLVALERTASEPSLTGENKPSVEKQTVARSQPMASASLKT